MIENDNGVSGLLVKIKTKDGEAIPCKISGSVQRDDRGKIIGYAVIINDVRHELLKTQHDLEVAVREAADKARLEAVMHLMHDVRNPSATIKIALEVLLKRLEDPEVPIDEITDRVKSIQVSLEASVDLLMRLNKMLSTSEINPILPEEVTIGEFADMVNNITWEHEAYAEHRGQTVSLKTEFDKLGQQKLAIDKAQIREVVMNLLSNAMKYSENGDSVELSISTDRDWVILTCKDDGIGIPEEDIDKIFHNENRASNVGEIEGSGYGLQILKKIVEAHGGKIEVLSRLGVGSEFKVYLPFLSK